MLWKTHGLRLSSDDEGNLPLVDGWAYPSEKYEFVSWDDDIPNIWENKECSKPPTRPEFY